MTRTSAFTLATALAWHGHDCPGGCPPEAAQLRASIWRARWPDLDVRPQVRMLLVVDFSVTDLPAGAIRTLLRGVNRCVRDDHIVVRERIASDDGGSGARTA